MLTRLIDFLKVERITSLVTSLTSSESEGGSEAAVSSLMDTWLLLRNTEQASQRNRVLYVLKSRGMAHSQDVRDFRLTSKGIELGIPHLEQPAFAARFPASTSAPPAELPKRRDGTGNGSRRVARASNNQA
jgi:KaiC/GvpD/RAD55 family RecA-like ATPase